MGESGRSIGVSSEWVSVGSKDRSMNQQLSTGQEDDLLNGETIMCISAHPWTSLQQNRQQIMSRLAKHNRIFFFEPQRDPSRSLLDNSCHKLCNLFQSHSNSASPTLTVVNAPPAIPSGGGILPSNWAKKLFSKIGRINCQVLLTSIRRTARRFNIRQPVLWLSAPWYLYLVGECDERLVCYEVYDEISQYPQNAKVRGALEKLDEQLTRRADLVIATSQAQTDRRKKYNPFTYFVSNAVDFDFFHQALLPKTLICRDVANLKRPRIGYCGFLGFQIDVKLLFYLANAKPQWEWILVGPDSLGVKPLSYELRRLNNVHFLGYRLMAELPGILKGLDVAIMPYDLNTHVRTSYPTKLHEYLAAGKPVVSVDLPELKPYSDIVYLSKNPSEFLSKIEQALAENSPERVAQRVQVAAANTWDQRVEQISALISQKLRQKASS
jgi:glycosyltransferase involved in cell wall biosynthesis